MSTRLIVPKSLDYSRMCPQNPQHRLKTARRLFGKPNPDETKKFLDVAFDIQQRKFSEKYNFDIINDVPIVGPTAKYTYLECKIIEAPRKKRPIGDVEELDIHYFRPAEYLINRLEESIIQDSATVPEPQRRDATKDKKQRSMKDFMQTRKRNITSTEKPEPVITSKMPKLDLNG